MPAIISMAAASQAQLNRLRGRLKPLGNLQTTPAPAAGKPSESPSNPDDIFAALLAQDAPRLTKLVTSADNLRIDDDDGQNLICRAVLMRWQAGVELLLAHGVPADDGNAHGETGLYLACKTQWRQGALLLLDAGANAEHLAPFNATPLDLAACQNDVALVKEMLAKGMRRGMDRSIPQAARKAEAAGAAQTAKLLRDPDAMWGYGFAIGGCANQLRP